MADKQTAPPEAPSNEPTPSESAETQQWADLAKELGEEGEPTEVTETKPEGEGEAPTETEPKPKPSYEQLEHLERNKTAALKEEREARRRAEESLGNVNKLIDELRASRAQQQPRQQQAEPPPLPDVNEDPIGHFQAKVAMLERALETTYRGNQQTAQHIQAQQEEQVFWNHVRSAENEFRKTSPMVKVGDNEMSDYDAACEHLKTHRIGELTHLYPDNSAIAQQEARQYGFPTPAHLRAAMLQQDAIAVAQRAFQLGISPAQLYYEAAKTRGYKTPAPAEGDAKAKIAAAKRGQKAALTISGGEGRKSNSDLSLSDLSDLFIDDPEEFDKQWDRMKAAGKL